MTSHKSDLRRYRARWSGQLKVGNCVLSDRVVPRSQEWAFSLEVARMREIETVIQARYGQFLPETADAERYIRAAAFTCSQQDMFEWCARWAPWAIAGSIDLLEAMIAQASTRQRMLAADAVATLLEVTMEERTRLGLHTIGASDISRDERNKLARNRKRERDRERAQLRRREEGRPERATLLKHSHEARRPWDDHKVSRSTWYRQRRETAASRVEDI